MGIFGFLKKTSDEYKVHEWWKSLTPEQRKLIWFKEKPEDNRKERIWADVWIIFTDGSSSQIERRTVFATQVRGGISVKPTSTWRFWPKKVGQVRCVRVQPDGWDGFVMDVPMYDHHINETDYVQVLAN